MDKKALLRKYNRLESNNNHNDCAILLAQNFGTKDEVETLEKIKSVHLKRGHILFEEIDVRREISSKYYKLLF
jgi:hypothetical protein